MGNATLQPQPQRPGLEQLLAFLALLKGLWESFLQTAQHGMCHIVSFGLRAFGQHPRPTALRQKSLSEVFLNPMSQTGPCKPQRTLVKDLGSCLEDCPEACYLALRATPSPQRHISSETSLRSGGKKLKDLQLRSPGIWLRQPKHSQSLQSKLASWAQWEPPAKRIFPRRRGCLGLARVATRFRRKPPKPHF